MDTVIIIALSLFTGVALSAAVALVVRKKERTSFEKLLDEKLQLKEKEALLEVAEERNRLQLDFDKKQIEQNQCVREKELDLKSREDEVVSNLLRIERDREQIEKRREELIKRLEDQESSEIKLRQSISEYRDKLYELGGLSEELLKKEALSCIEEEIKEEVAALREEALSKTDKEVQREAKGIIISCMQRLSALPQEDISATIVSIPSDDMKGRIIGREGRNIKSFESMTGTTLLIDETPDSVLVSSFDPVRRETARIALEALLKDGRIHPSSIEAAVEAAEEEVKKSVAESGEEALRRLRLTKMHPEIVSAIGQMRFRLSNNQNLLEHSIEVANLAALMASELGLNTDLAKRAGLLHDIGKVLDQDHEGSHAKAGAFFLKRVGQQDPKVINAVAAHHEEVPPESPYVGILMTADSLSAVRPGARADSMDGYIQRIKNLEGIAKKMDGVTEAYAIQAGREIRVIVAPGDISENKAPLIARRIRRKIEDELQYPGTIKVTVIREQRFEEIAE